MSIKDLKALERSSFRAATDTGLWDVFLASIFATLAIVPFLSGRLGDFWSSALILPVSAVVYLIVRAVQSRVIVPRVGVIEVGPERRARLRRLTLIMTVANVLALALGTYAATQATEGQQILARFLFPMMLLVGFSVAAYFLQILRVFVYGVLLAGALPIGEELFRRGYAPHHGIPIAFGVAAAIIFVSGLVRFWRVLPRTKGGSGGLLQGRNNG